LVDYRDVVEWKPEEGSMTLDVLRAVDDGNLPSNNLHGSNLAEVKPIM
jgi:hypothetical protein